MSLERFESSYYSVDVVRPHVLLFRGEVILCAVALPDRPFRHKPKKESKKNKARKENNRKKRTQQHATEENKKSNARRESK